MLIKKMYEMHDVCMERILIREQKKLGLAPSEVLVLLSLFANYRKKTFSTSMIVKRTNLTATEVGVAIESLITKGFLVMLHEEKDGKTREVFSLDKTFHLVEQLYHELPETISSVEIEVSIAALEKLTKKSLSLDEIETVRSWYANDNYSHNQISSTINAFLAIGSATFKQVAKFLATNEFKSAPKKHNVSKTIDDLYRQK